MYPLWKDGKPDRSNPRNYRGISLSDTLGKLFERILYNRAICILEPGFSPFQSAGRKRRSTTAALIRILSEAKCAIEAREYREYSELPVRINYALLDSSKAFDSMLRSVVY